MTFDVNTRPDLGLAALLAAASSAAYLEDGDCDVELAKLGFTVLAHVDQPAAHAVLASFYWGTDAFAAVITRGTEFTQAVRTTRESLAARIEAIKSCFRNVDQAQAPFPSGGYAVRGYLVGARDIFGALRPKLALARPATRILYAGHSQGGVCSIQLAGLAAWCGYDASFYAIAPPKPGDADFAAAIADVPGWSIERDHDFAPTHDVFTGWTVKPRPLWWAQSAELTIGPTAGRPGINESVSDHDDALYRDNLAAIAAKGDAAWRAEA
jgi:hypothetical protein